MSYLQQVLFENIEAKGETAHYQQLLGFAKVFSTLTNNKFIIFLFKELIHVVVVLNRLLRICCK